MHCLLQSHNIRVHEGQKQLQRKIISITDQGKEYQKAKNHLAIKEI